MAAYSDTPTRRKRYEREPCAKPCSLTPAKLQLLTYIGQFGFASLPQLAKLIGASEKVARRHLRAMFDSGYVDVTSVPRAALAGPEQASDLSLLFGSAPNIYTLAPRGLKSLRERDLPTPTTSANKYGPGNSLFLAHELLVRDVRVFFELSARRWAGHRVTQWRDGAAAVLANGRTAPPREVRPDAVLVYDLGGKVMPALLEADRGTERGDSRWKDKITAYDALFAGNLKQAIGYSNARVLVVATSQRRCDWLAKLVLDAATPDLAARFWLATRDALEAEDVVAANWWRPDTPKPAGLLTLQQARWASTRGNS